MRQPRDQHDLDGVPESDWLRPVITSGYAGAAALVALATVAGFLLGSLIASVTR